MHADLKNMSKLKAANARRHAASKSPTATKTVTTPGCSGVVVEYRTRNREVAGSTHTRSTARNLEQVANLVCA